MKFQVTEKVLEDWWSGMEEEMATSVSLSGVIPRTEAPAGLQSMECEEGGLETEHTERSPCRPTA